jgi:hypothetical protein
MKYLREYLNVYRKEPVHTYYREESYEAEIIIDLFEIIPFSEAFLARAARLVVFVLIVRLASLHPGRRVLDACGCLKMQPRAPVDCFFAALIIYVHSDTLVLSHAEKNQQNKAKIVAPSKKASG